MNFLERYQFKSTDILGSGGFSSVYKAYDKELDRYVAVKVFNEDSDKNPLLKLEIQKAIKFDHPNLCRFFDISELKSTNPFGDLVRHEVAIMELLEGGDLKTYLQRHPRQMEGLLRGVLEGLGYLHRKGIIHRDLKPQNILIKLDDNLPIAKITDFGISKQTGAEQSSSSALVGTIEYMAPEQFNPMRYGINGKIDTGVDLWSFGVMVYELVMGEKLFGSRSGNTSAEQVMAQILDASQLQSKLQQVPDGIRTLLERCLVQEASKRAASAEELLGYLGGEVKAAPTPKAINKNPYSANEETRVLEKETRVLEQKPKQVESGSSPVSTNQEPDKSKKYWIYGILAIGIIGLGIYLYPKYEAYQQAKKAEEIAQQNEEERKRILPQVLEEIESNMVEIPSGSFRMGCTSGDSECEDNERPTHQVSLSGFRMSKYEVTQRQWEAVMGSNPSGFKGCEECPVEGVSWYDAQAFIEKLNSLTGKNYRLPTEAEWEYAARGGEQNDKYSGSDDIGAVAWYYDNSGSKTHPVGQKQANGFGLYDMSGNVWEWCSDRYGDYSSNSQSNLQGPSTSDYRVFRGGGWGNVAGDCRVSGRIDFSPDYRNYSLGFRLAR